MSELWLVSSWTGLVGCEVLPGGTGILASGTEAGNPRFAKSSLCRVLGSSHRALPCITTAALVHKHCSASRDSLCCLMGGCHIFSPFWLGSSAPEPEEPFASRVLMKWDISRGFLRFVPLSSPHKRH